MERGRNRRRRTKSSGWKGKGRAQGWWKGGIGKGGVQRGRRGVGGAGGRSQRLEVKA